MARGDRTNTIKGIIGGQLISASHHGQLQVGALPRAEAGSLSR